MQTQITRRCVIEEETKEFAEILSATLQVVIYPLNNQLGYIG